MNIGEFSQILEKKNVDVYGDSSSGLRSFLESIPTKEVVYYVHDIEDERKGDHAFRTYTSSAQVVNSTADVCFLEGDAIKVLFARYPKNPRYVLVRLAPRLSWLLGLPGLLRRTIRGWIKVRGVIVIGGEERTMWMVLEKTVPESSRKTLLFLPESVGVQVFLDWMGQQKIPYVILRFYEKLPELYRTGGDFDVLIFDEDREKIYRFFQKHQNVLSNSREAIRFDFHSVEGGHGIVPYYPPPLARQIIQNSIDGPAGSRIPAAKEALFSFIYHALYHKGYDSGIKSTLSSKIETNPENDYGGVIQNMAQERGLHLEINLEALDEYLATNGWRPHLDTLAKIAERNAWVRRRFFSEKDSEAAGLAVFVLKEKALVNELDHKILDLIANTGFRVIRRKLLSDIEKEHAADNLRGGNWADLNGKVDELLPALIVVAIDLHCIGLSSMHAAEYERLRIRKLKERMRRHFDSERVSVVHSTDNTRESKQYIEICFPEEADGILKEFLDYRMRYAGSMSLQVKRLFSPLYIRYRIHHFIREFFTKWLM